MFYISPRHSTHQITANRLAWCFLNFSIRINIPLKIYWYFELQSSNVQKKPLIVIQIIHFSSNLGFDVLIFFMFLNFIYGGFLKWWYPQNTPTWPFLVGNPMVVGYHHFRKPPYNNMKTWRKMLGFLLSPPGFSSPDHGGDLSPQLTVDQGSDGGRAGLVGEPRTNITTTDVWWLCGLDFEGTLHIQDYPSLYTSLKRGFLGVQIAPQQVFGCQGVFRYIYIYIEREREKFIRQCLFFWNIFFSHSQLKRRVCWTTRARSWVL